MSVSGTPTTYAYDANGNLTGEGTKVFEYDAENRLTRVLESGSEVVRIVYDGHGNRVQKIAGGITRTYIYDVMTLLEERLSTGSTLRYVDGPGLDEPLAVQDGSGALSYYLVDHLA